MRSATLVALGLAAVFTAGCANSRSLQRNRVASSSNPIAYGSAGDVVSPSINAGDVVSTRTVQAAPVHSAQYSSATRSYGSPPPPPPPPAMPRSYSRTHSTVAATTARPRKPRVSTDPG